MKHVMLDLETLGVTPGCVVLSIGACVFTDTGVEDTFTVDLDMHDQTEKGLRIESGTLEWWVGNKGFSRTRMNVKPSDEAMIAFARWLSNARPRGGKSMNLWANSPQFDFAILGAAYTAFGMPLDKLPWAFWELRDYRTAVRMLNRPWNDIKKTSSQTAHRALQDAIDQAETLTRFGFFDRWQGEY